MESLQIRTGELSVRILDDAGNERGIFKFNPTDVNLAKSVIELQAELEIQQKQFEDRVKECETDQEKITLMSEVVTYYRGLIDKVFGEGSSQILFGDAVSLTMFSDFFDGITPYFEKARKDVKAKYTKAKR